MAERPGTLALVGRQVGYQNRLFWRSPVAAVFTLAFPLFFLVLFNAILSDPIEMGELGVLSIAQFYAPALAVFTAASATYTNLTVTVAIARDRGILKRFRGTPLPPWAYLAGRMGSAAWIALIGVTAMLAVGALAYDLEIRWSTLPAALVTFGVGVICFGALGLAMAALVPNGDGAPAAANFTILPLAFVSDVFLPLGDPPAWMRLLGDLFPLKHFVAAFQAAFSPATTDAGFRWDHLGVMALWAVLGVAVALRRFAWEPHAAGGRRSRRRPDPDPPTEGGGNPSPA